MYMLHTSTGHSLIAGKNANTFPFFCSFALPGMHLQTPGASCDIFEEITVPILSAYHSTLSPRRTWHLHCKRNRPLKSSNKAMYCHTWTDNRPPSLRFKGYLPPAPTLFPSHLLISTPRSHKNNRKPKLHHHQSCPPSFVLQFDTITFCVVLAEDWN